MTDSELARMQFWANTVKDEIDRMCMTESLLEFVTMHGQAVTNLDKLTRIICESRFPQESEE